MTYTQTSVVCEKTFSTSFVPLSQWEISLWALAWDQQVIKTDFAFLGLWLVS